MNIIFRFSSLLFLVTHISSVVCMNTIQDFTVHASAHSPQLKFLMPIGEFSGSTHTTPQSSPHTSCEPSPEPSPAQFVQKAKADHQVELIAMDEMVLPPAVAQHKNRIAKSLLYSPYCSAACKNNGRLVMCSDPSCHNK